MAEAKCTLQACPVSESAIGYYPSLSANLFLAIIFSLLVPIHIFLGIRHRAWGFMVGMTCGLAGEVLGYVSRARLKANPFNHNAFML